MATSNKPVQGQAQSPKSLKDAGYQAAGVYASMAVIAAFVLEQCPDFPDTISSEAKADLIEGFKLRAHEKWGIDYFTKGDTGAMVKVGNSLDKGFVIPKGAEQMNVMLAYSYTQQQFGRMKTEDPQGYGILQEWRSRFAKYSSAVLKAIADAARAQLKGDETKTRAAVKAFTDAVKAAFDTLDKRVKTAAARGTDPTANEVKHREAVAAYWNKYNS
jgi:hypothetical protein